MKTKWFCECCEQEYPTPEICAEHEVMCRSSDAVYTTLNKLPAKVNLQNIDSVLACLEVVVSRLKSIRLYLRRHKKPLAVDADEPEHFYIGERNE